MYLLQLSTKSFLLWMSLIFYTYILNSSNTNNKQGGFGFRNGKLLTRERLSPLAAKKSNLLVLSVSSLWQCLSSGLTSFNYAKMFSFRSFKTDEIIFLHKKSNKCLHKLIMFYKKKLFYPVFGHLTQIFPNGWRGHYLCKESDPTKCSEAGDKIDKTWWAFQFSNFYTVCGDGSFSSVSSAPLVPSSYHGCHRSGPLWSVQSLPGHKPRLWPQSIGTHLTYELTLCDAASDEVLTRASAVKSFLAAGVKRVVVREGCIRGVLFLPPEPGPAVITIYGGASNNRVPEDRWV